MSSRIGASKTPFRSSKGRPRKSPFSADTNLGSYDRKDPFRAFNVLAGLLASLATRVGGCQYKLTTEEHTLSLHLLSIVEPYISAHPSRRTLITRQPTEILDAIVFHIDSKQDLLSFALSCQRMYGIVIPRHFDYRHLRCKVSSISVWNHLIVNRSLAKNVRRLEIMDERSAETEYVPSGIMVSDTDLESTDDELSMHDKQERFLVAALTRMASLASFTWSCNHSPMSIGNVWPTLLKCRSLEEVHIKDNMIFSASEEEPSTGRSLVLPSVKTASFQSTKHKYGACPNPGLARVKGLLNYCPNLENLDISYTRPQPSAPAQVPADELFLYGRWQHLNSLTLTNLRCLPGGGLDAASAFLLAHNSLEILHLDITGMTSSTRLTLGSNALPRLRELKANKDIIADILQSPTDEPRPLEILKGIRLSGSQAGDQAFMTSLKLFAPDVKRIELSGWHDMEDIRRLVEAAPRLVWLDTGKKLTGAPGIVNNTVEWASLLSGVPDLATFHGVKFFYEASQTATGQADRSRNRRNEEVASLLAWKCAKLRRLDHWEDGSSKVIILAREKDGVRWDVRRVKTSS
ncbi:hypothetical protein CPB85DRAFT_1214527 [Mucidula mucida]|nr:hypothetical protein CPB85DRAFT_1214527 [Mucidula mucida]